MCIEIDISRIHYSCPEPPRGMEVVKKHAEMTEAQYAHGALDEIRRHHGQNTGVYMDFLHDMFSGDTIEEAEQVALDQFRKTHQEYVKILKGFETNGKIYYLDRKEKVLFALYEKFKVKDGKTGYSRAITHYNPQGVDVIEQTLSDEVFFDNIESGIYNVSTDEEALISELWDLIFRENQKT